MHFYEVDVTTHAFIFSLSAQGNSKNSALCDSSAYKSLPQNTQHFCCVWKQRAADWEKISAAFAHRQSLQGLFGKSAAISLVIISTQCTRCQVPSIVQDVLDGWDLHTILCISYLNPGSGNEMGQRERDCLCVCVWLMEGWGYSEWMARELGWHTSWWTAWSGCGSVPPAACSSPCGTPTNTSVLDKTPGLGCCFMGPDSCHVTLQRVSRLLSFFWLPLPLITIMNCHCSFHLTDAFRSKYSRGPRKPQTVSRFTAPLLAPPAPASQGQDGNGPGGAEEALELIPCGAEDLAKWLMNHMHGFIWAEL